MLRKTLENDNFIRPALLCANIYQIFFYHLDTRKYLLLFFPEDVQLVPLLYHILQQGCHNSNWFLFCWDGVSTRTQIFERKWNWQNMFTQIFLSEIISTAENGGQGTHFLISQILKGLTHSALLGSAFHVQLILSWPRIWPARDMHNIPKPTYVHNIWFVFVSSGHCPLQFKP